MFSKIKFATNKMPRGKSLNEEEKGRIKAYKECGLKNRDIAVKIGRSHNLVNNFLKNSELYGTAKRSGRPPKLSDRTKRRILGEVSIYIQFVFVLFCKNMATQTSGPILWNTRFSE